MATLEKMNRVGILRARGGSSVFDTTEVVSLVYSPRTRR